MLKISSWILTKACFIMRRDTSFRAWKRWQRQIQLYSIESLVMSRKLSKEVEAATCRHRLRRISIDPWNRIYIFRWRLNCSRNALVTEGPLKSSSMVFGRCEPMTAVAAWNISSRRRRKRGKGQRAWLSRRRWFFSVFLGETSTARDIILRWLTRACRLILRWPNAARFTNSFNCVFVANDARRSCWRELENVDRVSREISH